MKKFNKVRTVKMQVNAEVLPLNTVFVARMMQTKADLEHMYEFLCDVVNAKANLDASAVPQVRKNVEEAIGFFNDLYEAMTEEEQPEVTNY